MSAEVGDIDSRDLTEINAFISKTGISAPFHRVQLPGRLQILGHHLRDIPSLQIRSSASKNFTTIERHFFSISPILRSIDMTSLPPVAASRERTTSFKGSRIRTLSMLSPVLDRLSFGKKGKKMPSRLAGQDEGKMGVIERVESSTQDPLRTTKISLKSGSTFLSRRISSPAPTRHTPASPTSILAANRSAQLQHYSAGSFSKSSPDLTTESPFQPWPSLDASITTAKESNTSTIGGQVYALESFAHSSPDLTPRTSMHQHWKSSGLISGTVEEEGPEFESEEDVEPSISTPSSTLRASSSISTPSPPKPPPSPPFSNIRRRSISPPITEATRKASRAAALAKLTESSVPFPSLSHFPSPPIRAPPRPPSSHYSNGNRFVDENTSIEQSRFSSSSSATVHSQSNATSAGANGGTTSARFKLVRPRYNSTSAAPTRSSFHNSIDKPLLHISTPWPPIQTRSIKLDEEKDPVEEATKNVKLARSFLESLVDPLSEGDTSGFEKGAEEAEFSLWGVLRDGSVLVEWVFSSFLILTTFADADGRLDSSPCYPRQLYLPISPLYPLPTRSHISSLRSSPPTPSTLLRCSSPPIFSMALVLDSTKSLALWSLSNHASLAPHRLSFRATSISKVVARERTPLHLRR